MPYARPTLTQLRNQALQDLISAQVTDPSGNVLTNLWQNALLRVMLIAQAGHAYEHYGYLDYIAKQAVPWSASAEYLEGWAALKGIIRQQPTATIGTVTFTGTTGIPAGTSIVRQDGTVYSTTAAGTVSGSTTTVTMQAFTAGSAGNFSANTQFNLQTPISGMLATSTASAQTTAGTDLEADTSLQSRMLLAYANPPQGGDRTDYVEWAMGVPGVTRAWVTPQGMGAGTVVLFFMMDNAEAAFSGFPQGTTGTATNEPRDVSATGDQLTVANALFVEQPVNALVYTAAPTAQPTNFTIADLGINNTPAMLTSMQAALTNMFLRLGQVGGTVNPITGITWAGIEPDAWYAALEAIPGLTGFKVTTPSAALTPTNGSLLTLGTITPVT